MGLNDPVGFEIYVVESLKVLLATDSIRAVFSTIGLSAQFDSRPDGLVV